LRKHLRPKRLPGAQVGERDVASAANWLPYIPIHLLQSQGWFPELGILWHKKNKKKAEKGKKKGKGKGKGKAKRNKGKLH
jgi:hypothetical protein